MEKNSIFGISEFSTCVLYANVQFSRWSRDHFPAHFIIITMSFVVPRLQ